MADADALARLRQFVSEGETPAPAGAKQATKMACELSMSDSAASSSNGDSTALGVSFLDGGVPDFSSWPNEPIPLISPEMGTDGVEVLTVNAEALAMLRRIPVAVAVLAVSGLYRTGKSSLLNWLVDPTINAAYDLNTTSAPAVADTDSKDEEAAPPGATDSASILGSGFAVGATVQRCTRGIWIWGRPRAVTLRDGSVGALLVLDTEGLGGLESEGRYDARIFALATLLCSTLAYNSLGTIDEKAIGSLSFIAELSRNIKVTGEEDGSSSSSDKSTESSQSSGNRQGRGAAADAGLQEFFPEFCWIVRDFALELVTEDGEPMTSDQYLESALQPQAGFDASTVERNAIRRAVTSYFSTRRTVTMVRPLSDERRLQKVDEVPFDELRPEFRRDFAHLQDALLSRPRPKTLGAASNRSSGNNSSGRPLTGPMYATLVEEYAREVSGPSGVPVIATAWESVAAQEVAAAAANAAQQHANALAALGTDAPSGHYANTEFALIGSAAGDDRSSGATAMDNSDESGAGVALPPSVSTFLPRDQAEGAAVHARAYATCLKLFDTRADGSAAASARQALETTMTAAFSDWSTRNAAASQQASQQVLSQLYSKCGLAALEALPTHDVSAETAPGDPTAVEFAGNKTSGLETVGRGEENLSSSSGAAAEGEKHPLADPKEGPALVARLFGQLTAEFNQIAVGTSSTSSSSLGPRASAELAAFLAVKWPLLSARCAAAAHAAHETEAAKLDAILADTQRRIAATETRDGARNGDAAAKDSEVSALRLEVAKLGAQADGTSARQAVLEQQRVEAQKRASNLTLAAEEAQQETERLVEDLRRAKNEAADLEKERALLQDRLEAIPAYEPPPAACCALQ